VTNDIKKLLSKPLLIYTVQHHCVKFIIPYSQFTHSTNWGEKFGLNITKNFDMEKNQHTHIISYRIKRDIKLTDITQLYTFDMVWLNCIP